VTLDGAAFGSFLSRRYRFIFSIGRSSAARPRLRAEKFSWRQRKYADRSLRFLRRAGPHFILISSGVTCLHASLPAGSARRPFAGTVTSIHNSSPAGAETVDSMFRKKVRHRLAGLQLNPGARPLIASRAILSRGADLPRGGRSPGRNKHRASRPEIAHVAFAGAARRKRDPLDAIARQSGANRQIGIGRPLSAPNTREPRAIRLHISLPGCDNRQLQHRQDDPFPSRTHCVPPATRRDNCRRRPLQCPSSEQEQYS